MSAPLLLLASHLLAPAAVAPGNPTPDPPLRVWFNSDGNYAYTDRAKVFAKSAEDGYLLVLRADAAGRVKVLFPLDPGDDQRIARGRKYELKGRGGREAFIADDTTGYGTVIAAISATPFRLDRFARDGHWDLKALSDPQLREDAEVGLRGLVQRMQPSGDSLVYSLATYVVSQQYARPRYAQPYARNAWWGYDPWWGYRSRFGFRYRPWGW